MAILIKRYANRKLYNTETSRYITLKGIAKLLDEGREVRVIDNESGEDITQVALSQILVGNQRAKESPSDTLLTQILSRGGDALYDAIRKSVDDAADGLGEFQDRVRSFVKESESIARGERGFDWGLRSDGERRSPFAGARGSSGKAEGSSGKAEGSGGRGSDASMRGGETTRGREAPRADERSETRVDEGDGVDGFRTALRKIVRGAFEERDLPKRADLLTLNRNLERVADAVERLEALMNERDRREDGGHRRD